MNSIRNGGLCSKLYDILEKPPRTLTTAAYVDPDFNPHQEPTDQASTSDTKQEIITNQDSTQASPQESTQESTPDSQTIAQTDSSDPYPSDSGNSRKSVQKLENSNNVAKYLNKYEAAEEKVRPKPVKVEDEPDYDPEEHKPMNEAGVDRDAATVTFQTAPMRAEGKTFKVYRNLMIQGVLWLCFSHF